MPRVSADEKRIRESRLEGLLLAGTKPEDAARVVGCGKTKAYEVYKALGGRDGIRQRQESARLQQVEKGLSGLPCNGVEGVEVVQVEGAEIEQVLEQVSETLSEAYQVRHGLIPPPDEPPEGYWEEGPDEDDIDFYISELMVSSPEAIIAGLARHKQRGGVHVMDLIDKASEG